jgi:5-carboxymethyl-2-hydroxymuconate isomerase
VAHLTYEYTANIQAEADITGLLRKSNQILIAQDGVFPTGGLRSRAIELTEYFIADGAADYAFVHGTLKIGAGRNEATRKRVCDALFAMMKEHFAAAFAKRYLALSLELYQFDEGGTYKHNNLHARFKKSG